MWKVILVTLFVLFGMSAVFALRPASRDALAELAAAAPLNATTAYSPNEAIETFKVNSGAKADRLPVAASGDEAKKVVIEPVKVARSQIQAAEAPITSWHWHAGSNKITRK
jgi:hypothetical protein